MNRSVQSAAVTVAVLALFSAAPISQAQTSTWEWKCDGASHHCLGAGQCVVWPYSLSWTRDEAIGPHPYDEDIITTLAPSNWTTAMYPDNARGGSHNVVVSSGPPPQLFDTVTIDALTVASGSTLDIRSVGASHSGKLTIDGASYLNDGSILINDIHSGGALFNFGVVMLRFSQDTTLNGAGRIVFSTPNSNTIDGDPDGLIDVLLTNSADHTITTASGGLGAIAPRILNHGVIDANDGTITISKLVGAPTGVLSAAGGGGIVVSEGAIDNSAGTITISGGSSGRFGSGSAPFAIDNGTVTNAGALTLVNSTLAGLDLVGGGHVNAWNARFEDAAIAQSSVSLTIDHAGVTLAGGIEHNTTTILADPSSPGGNFGSRSTFLRIDGAVTLSGFGGIEFASPYQNNVVGDDGVDDSLTIGSGQSISTTGVGSAGHISGLDLINHGGITADNGSITLNVPNLTNDSATSLAAVNGGALTISGAQVDNTGGLISIDASSSAVLSSNTTVTGGRLTNAGSMTMNGAGLSGLPFDGGGNVNVINGSFENVDITQASVNLTVDHAQAVFAGGFLHNATTTLADPSSSGGSFGSRSTFLRISGDVILNGAGGVRFGTPYQNNIVGADGVDDSLMIGSNQSVSTTGVGSTGHISGLDLVNHGTIAADNGTITINVPSLINDSADSLRAVNGGMLDITAAQVDNTGGLIEVDATSSVRLTGGASVDDGTFTNAGSMVMNGAGLSNLTLDGGGGIGLMNGSFDSVDITQASISLSIDRATATFAGAFEHNVVTTLHDPSAAAGRFGSQTTTLWIDGPVTLGGTGAIRFATPYQNNVSGKTGGSVLALQAGQRLQVDANDRGYISVPLTNHGKTIIEEGGMLVINTPMTTSDTSFFSGSGTLNLSGQTLVNTGLITPGASAGTFSLLGGYQQGPGGVLSIEIAGSEPGQYDLLSISGSAALGGLLEVILLDGFKPRPGDTFTILTSGGLGGSMFANAPETVDVLNGGQFDVIYGGQDVQLANYVPEPGAIALFGAIVPIILKRRRICAAI